MTSSSKEIKPVVLSIALHLAEARRCHLDSGQTVVNPLMATATMAA